MPEVTLDSKVFMNGNLVIDSVNGTIEFKEWLDNQVILRVTHLDTPIPINVMIDVVAIRNLTSYTPITSQPAAQIVKGGQPAYERPEDFHREAREASLARHPSTGIYDRPVSADISALGLVSKEGWDENPDERCEVCTRIHTSGEYVKWGPYDFIQSHEYIIWTRTSQQTYAHSARMQFLGAGKPGIKYQLIFNARGPNRSTGSQYAGTQSVDARNIVRVEEVECIPAERYTDKIDRNMKRDE